MKIFSLMAQPLAKFSYLNLMSMAVVILLLDENIEAIRVVTHTGIAPEKALCPSLTTG